MLGHVADIQRARFTLPTRKEVVDTNAELPESADEIIALSGLIATPGLINTHHHFYQNLTRAVPAGQDATLFGWLQAHYPIWA